MQNFNECPQADLSTPENDNGVDSVTSHPVTDETIKITAKIIADFADWVRVYGAFAIGFLTPITIYVWVLAVIGLVGVRNE